MTFLTACSLSIHYISTFYTSRLNLCIYHVHLTIFFIRGLIGCGWRFLLLGSKDDTCDIVQSNNNQFEPHSSCNNAIAFSGLSRKQTSISTVNVWYCNIRQNLHRGELQNLAFLWFAALFWKNSECSFLAALWSIDNQFKIIGFLNTMDANTWHYNTP